MHNFDNIHCLDSDSSPIFSIEDIDNAFADVIPVSFHQPKTLNINDTEFVICALNAGYSLGGAIWRITYRAHKLIYAIDVNDKNESITEPLRMHELKDAHYLITNTYIDPFKDGKNKTQLIKQDLSKYRLRYHITKTLLDHLKFEPQNLIAEQETTVVDSDPKFMDGIPIGEVLMKYGLTNNVTQVSNKYPCAGQYDAEMLIVCDNFSRVLEVLLLLEDLSEQIPELLKIPILYLEHMSNESMEIASSHIEWMNNRLKSSFAYIEKNPMNFKSIEKISSEEELQKFQNPRIVVTTSLKFLLRHSRNLLPKVLKNRNSELILINKQLSNSLGTNSQLEFL